MLVAADLTPVKRRILFCTLQLRDFSAALLSRPPDTDAHLGSEEWTPAISPHLGNGKTSSFALQAVMKLFDVRGFAGWEMLGLIRRSDECMQAGRKVG